ncbi:MAG: glutaredoxin [Patescibacteria group bacterium]|nr:glutaredoxin [Patescibacteria group bacterium]
MGITAWIKNSKVMFVVSAFLMLLGVGCIPAGCNGVKAGEELIIYVSEGCPHCKKVEEYIAENDLDDEVIIKNTTVEEDAREEFTNFLDENEVPYEERGVPMMIYDDGEWLAGDSPIIEVLSEKFSIDGNVSAVEHERETNSGDLMIIVGGAFVLALVVGYGIFNAIDARRKH